MGRYGGDGRRTIERTRVIDIGTMRRAGFVGRHARDARAMSAFTPIAFKHWQRSETTLCARNRHMHRSKTASLFDHLVGAQEEISTDRQSERSRCFEIDDKLEFGGLLNRQVGRLRAFQNLVDVSGGAQEQIR
jgi:hypothetical protein